MVPSIVQSLCSPPPVYPSPALRLLRALPAHRTPILLNAYSLLEVVLTHYFPGTIEPDNPSARPPFPQRPQLKNQEEISY
jgi:hypothetical protein